ncbi:MAG: accessory factor UbiK family protein [Gammaproteobacteria bacterium]|nr:accessory factor UbiK family protein [Gammaproteobacteria bacterium]
MLDLNKLEQLAEDLKRLLPEGTDTLHASLKQNVRLVAETVMQRMDLVSRDEFDAQCAVLSRTREKLEAIQKRLDAMEEQLGIVN